MNIDIISIIEKYGFLFLLLVLIFVAMLLLVKKIVELTIDNMFSDRLAKKSQEYINNLNRRTLAYEILLKKELEYYENISNFTSSIVVDIQDVLWNYEKFLSDENGEKYKEKATIIFSKILKDIIVTKKDSLMFESYSNSKVHNAHIAIICYLQDNALEITNILISLENKKENVENIKSVCENTLILASKLMNEIQERQKEIST